MNSKAIKRQLLAAIAMVLVAAIALGSSTYAWFANNNKVTADGITITAQSEGKLLIIDDDENFPHGEKTTVKMTANEDGKAEKLLPTHPIYTIGGTFTKWVHRTSDSYSVAISGSDTEKDVTNGTAKGDNFYYLSDELYIKLANNGVNGDKTTAKNLKLSELKVTTTEGSDAAKSLLSAVRIMLVVGDNKTYVYNHEGKEVTTEISENGETGVEYAASVNDSSVLADSVDTKNPVKISVYFYFDGRDTDCTSAKYDADQFAVSLAFTANLD